MSERKPPGVSWESWIERLIRDGQEAGAFDALPGAGRPIPDLDEPHDDERWLKRKLSSEEFVQVPPTIAIRGDRDATIATAMQRPTEVEVRELLVALNRRIAHVNAYATAGPPSSVGPVDVDELVERWRSIRPRAEEAEVPQIPEPAPDPPPARRWRRLRRRRPRTGP